MKHLNTIQSEFTKCAKDPAWWGRLTYEEQYQYMKSHPKTKLKRTSKPSTDLIQKIKNRKTYQRGLSSDLVSTDEYMKYIGSGVAGGYYGASNRNDALDAIVEDSLKAKGLGNNGAALWLASGSARHMMDGMPSEIEFEGDIKLATKERVEEYTKNAFRDVTIWSHPDHSGSVASSQELAKNIEKAFCNK